MRCISPRMLFVSPAASFSPAGIGRREVSRAFADCTAARIEAGRLGMSPLFERPSRRPTASCKVPNSRKVAATPSWKTSWVRGGAFVGPTAFLSTLITTAIAGGVGSVGRSMCAGAGDESEIEVEQKFHIEEGCVERVAASLEFKGEKLIRDTYFDVPSNLLTCTDHWLRLRDDAWELKEPISVPGAGGNQGLDTYREVTDEAMVAISLENLLGLEPGSLPQGGGDGVLLNALESVGCISFCTIVSKRRKYASGGIAVDLDEVVEPEGMDYSIGEVEVMAAGEGGVADAQARINAFMDAHGIKVATSVHHVTYSSTG